MIKFDEIFTVLVEATDIEISGQQRIMRTLNSVSLPPLPGGWDWSRLVQKGEFRGKFTKRVATYYKKKYDKKLSSSVLMSIGNKVDQYSFRKGAYILGFTRKLDWAAGDFGDHGSCFGAVES